MFRTGKDAGAPSSRQKGLAQVSDTGRDRGGGGRACSPGTPARWRSTSAGKKQVLGFFMGQVMKAMKGKGNPQRLNELLKKKLGEP